VKAWATVARVHGGEEAHVLRQAASGTWLDSEGVFFEFPGHGKWTPRVGQLVAD